MSKMARMGALAALMKVLDDGDTDSLRGSHPFGDAGDKNPLEKSGYEGEVSPAQSFAEGGEIGSGDHDETSPDMFAAQWEQLTGKTWRRKEDQEGLGGDSEDDGSGMDAASEGDDEDDDKPLGKR